MKEDNWSLQLTNGRKTNGSTCNNDSLLPSTNMDEWKRTMSASTRFRIGSASVHLGLRTVLQFCVALLIFVVLALIIYNHVFRRTKTLTNHLLSSKVRSYNDKYPLTKPIVIPNGHMFTIAVITDLDHSSKVKESLWKSHYLKGYLTVTDDLTFQVQFDPESVEIHSTFAQGKFVDVNTKTICKSDNLL